MILIEDFNQIPTLQFLSTTQLVITIWNRADIVRSITQAVNNRHNIDDVDRLLDIDARVLEILNSIGNIPNIFTEDWRHLITPIGRHIKAMRTFANFDPYLESLHREFPVDLWTPYGTVDIKRLDKMLVQDVRRDICFRYHLASNDCFEEDISELLPLLTELQILSYGLIINNTVMLVYWSRRIAGDLHLQAQLLFPPFSIDIDFRDDMAFEISLLNGNKSGIEYFMNTLERHVYINVIREHLNYLLRPTEVHGYNRLRCKEHYYDAVYFLLSKLDHFEISDLRQYYCDILKKFLCYPFFGLFNGYRAAWLHNLRDHEIFSLLRKVAYLKAMGKHFFGYNLFDSFWFSLSENKRHQIENAEFDNTDAYHVALQEEITRVTQR